MDKNLSISLYSDCNFFSLSILENLLSKNCFVNVVTDNLKGWKESTAPLFGNKHFSLIEGKNFPNVISSYSVLVLGYGNKDPYEELDGILKKNPNNSSKVLILLPFEKYSFEKNSRFNFSGNLGVVYLGDLLGARMDLENNLLMTRAIREVYFKRTLLFSVGEILYPLFVNDVAKTVSRWLFSFGPYGRETLLIGTQVSTADFWKENVSLVGEVKINYDGETKPRYLPKGVEVKTLDSNLKFLLTETYRWLSKFPPKERPFDSPFFIRKTVKHKTQTETKPIVKNKRVYPKYFKPLILVTASMFAFPLALLLIAWGAMFVSYKQFLSGNDAAAENTLLVAKTFSVISKGGSKVLSYIPLVGRIYKELFFTAYVSEVGSGMAITSIPLIRNSSDLINHVLGNEIYDPATSASKITGSLDSLYRSLSLFQADSSEAGSGGIKTSKLLTSKIDFDKLISLTAQMKYLSQNLPSLLGKDESKSYLVLFQNNMELRPTGGFIGSFGILTFDGGRISDLTINDVYSADGQLNGHVEPPEPIKKYLGEANWWLRDSNWDPDFPTSAKRAEWFLDKEMGRSVDGVIGIDLQPIKNMLKYTGPVFLPDFNMDITSENLYEKTQAEVEEDFFPGTHKKASFLTALSRSLLANVSKLATTQKLGILKSFYTDLEGRSIQVFFHDDSSQNPISALRWDGGVATPDCGDKCFADMIGVVEANLGVNKTNFFVERSQNLSVSITPDKITRHLKLTLRNNANPALGPSGIYKTYVRLLSDGNSATTGVKLYTGPVSQNLPSESTSLKGRNETGVYVEIMGGQTKTLEFSWDSTLSSAGFDKYGVYLRKQAGTPAGPFSLTVNGISIYNGLLTGDVFSRVNW